MMAKTELKHNIPELGQLIRYIRKQKGMSPVACGSAFHQPSLMMNLLEHANMKEGAHICDLIPIQRINDLVTSIQENLGISTEELFSMADVPEVQEQPDDPNEVTLVLPVTVSVDSVIDMIDKIMLLSMNGSQHQCQCHTILQEGIMLACLLIQLLHESYVHAGRTAEAERCITRFSALLNQRM